MSIHVARLWQQVLDMLSDMASGSVADMGHLLVQHTQLLDQLGEMPQQPAATWRVLIQDMQVGRC